MSATGIEELQQQVSGLLQNLQSGRLIRPALLAGARVVAGGIRAAAPVGTRKRTAKSFPKLNKRITQAASFRIRGGKQFARAGALLKGKKGQQRAPQGVWIARGTKPPRKRGANGKFGSQRAARGGIKKLNDYVDRGLAATQGRAVDAILARLTTDIQGQLR